jgi:putative PIN family toxin of toxin-antitoxin system
VRLVLDTNTVISGLLWKGPPHVLLTAARRHRDISLHTSPKLLAELADVLTRKSMAPAVAASERSAETLMRLYLDAARITEPAIIEPVIRSDPDDDHVLACALAARADLIVSGDADLLDLKSYQGIPIVGSAEALRHIEQHASRA